MSDRHTTKAQLLAELAALKRRLAELEQQHAAPQVVDIPHLLSLNRLYATLSQINQAIVRVRDRNALFSEICRIAIEYGQFRLAWIGLLDETAQLVRPVVVAGEAQAYLTDIEITYRDDVRGHGPTGRAVREARAAICQDIATDPAMRPWRERALAFGLRSSASVPIRQAGRVIGMLAVYADRPSVFVPAEEQLINGIGLDVSFALDSIEQAQQRDRAEEHLRRAAARLADLHELDRVILAADSLLGLVQAALSRLRKLVPCQRASLMLFDETAAQARLYASDFVGDSPGLRDALLDLGSFGVIEELRQGRAQQVDDIRALDQSAADITALGMAGIRAFINAPLRADGKLLGALNAGATEPDAFSGDHLAVMQEVADQLALAVQQTRLRDSLAAHAAELEQRVTRRTAELHMLNAQLTAELLERRRMERTLSDQADLLELTHDAIIVRDADSRIVFWNSGAEETYGWSRLEAVGRVTHQLLNTQFPVSSEDVQTALRTTGQWAGELTHTRRDGSRSVILSRQSLQRDETGQPRRILEINRDITLRKQAEILLHERNEELRAFAYTVSHDLKAPLRGISGYAQELDRHHRAGLNDRAQFCLSQIILATRNLDQLIEDLLHYSRLETETPTLTDINVRELIERWRVDRQRQIDEFKVRLTLDLPENRVRGWERGLMQALTNVLDNALKYSRNSQPPQIDVRLDEDAAAYRLSVRDNGIGFDMKYHDRIFGLFNRLVRATEFEGTGAGLAIARKAIEKQGGRLWAESQPGAGATFTIEVPKPGDHS